MGLVDIRHQINQSIDQSPRRGKRTRAGLGHKSRLPRRRLHRGKPHLVFIDFGSYDW